MRKSTDKSLSQPWCSHSNTIHGSQLQNYNSITLAAAAPSNLDAAFTMRFAASRGKHASLYPHGNKTWHQSHAAILPLRSETTHTWTTTRCRTQRRNRLRSERPQPQPPHTRGTFHRRLQPLYREKRKVSCSGLLHNTTPMQQSCSHYNAFCSITWLTRMYVRTWQQNMATIIQPLHCDLQPGIKQAHGTTPPLVAEHTAAHTRHLSSPAAATLHGKTQRFPAPVSSHRPSSMYCYVM